MEHIHKLGIDVEDIASDARRFAERSPLASVEGQMNVESGIESPLYRAPSNESPLYKDPINK